MWQPNCSQSTLKARAGCYSQIRAFFDSRGIIEVETPILSHAGATDPHLASMTVHSTSCMGAQYLQTSPEFAMKRLLASGSGAIYQLCKTFRADELGQRHNPEFTMLEWYRPSYDLAALMQEISELVSHVCDLPKAKIVTYKHVFQKHFSINPFSSTDEVLWALVQRSCSFSGEKLDRDACLDLLLAEHIEPKLGLEAPCFLTDYPASQASLAKLKKNEEGDWVAARAELYIQGIEIANAYDELTDAIEQRKRFELDNVQRLRMGLPHVNIDEHLIQALSHGMPNCAGVALGVDRLLMIKLGTDDIQDVLSFSHERA